MVSDDLDLLALAEKSSANDLAFLIRAKEETKRLMKQSPTRDNITAFNRAKVRWLMRWPVCKEEEQP